MLKYFSLDSTISLTDILESATPMANNLFDGMDEFELYVLMCIYHIANICSRPNDFSSDISQSFPSIQLLERSPVTFIQYGDLFDPEELDKFEEHQEVCKKSKGFFN